MNNKLLAPQVFIIVLNWNGWDDTKECLLSLRELTYSNYKIVLVDNGSSDRSIELARIEFPEVKLIENGSNLGFAAGNNVAIQYALDHKADYIMLLNNDTIVDASFLEPLLSAFRDDQKVGFASPKIYYYNQPNVIWFFEGAIDWKIGWAYHKNPNQEDNLGLYQKTVETPVITGCCMLVAREVFEKIGLLDPRFFLIYEDSDWSWRATSAGYKGVSVAESHIWHKVSASFRRDMPVKGIFYFVRNNLFFIKKHAKQPIKTSLRFFWHWVVKPTLREIRQHENFWWQKLGLRLSGAVAYILHQYGIAPHYVEWFTIKNHN